MPSLPDFVIIGAQKAASTELVRALALHPDCTLHPVEQGFFRDPEFDPARLDEFRRQMPDPPTRRVGIKCPDYLASPEVPARLRHYLGHPQLIACLRDPVERAVSAYFWYVRWGIVPAVDVNEGLLRILHRPEQLNPMAQDVLSYGRYGLHLGRYLEIFDRESVLVVLHEDLRADFAGVVNETWRFLDLDPSLSVPVPSNANSSVYSMARLRLLRSRSRLSVVWNQAGDRAVAVRPATRTARAASLAVGALDRFALSPVLPNRRPELDPEVREQLEDYYRDDVLVLSKLLARSLDVWGIHQ